MTMILKKSNLKVSNRVKWSISIIIVILVLVIFFDWLGLFYWPRSLIQSAAAPFLKFLWGVKLYLSKISSAFLEARLLEQENQRLKEENLELLGRLSESKNKERENEFLRKEFEQPRSAEQENFKLLLTKTISKNPINFYSEILIDKGERDGVKIGQAVIISDRVLIGMISQVYWRTSLVILVNSNKFQTEIFTAESLASGIIKGQLNYLFLDFIPKEKHLKEGELVVTSGQNNFPRGLLLGKIKSFLSKPEQILQEVIVTPLFSDADLENIFIVLDY